LQRIARGLCTVQHINSHTIARTLLECCRNLSHISGVSAYLSTLGFFDDNVLQLVADVLRQPAADRSATVKNLLVLRFRRAGAGRQGREDGGVCAAQGALRVVPGGRARVVEQLPAYGSWKDPLALLLECYHGGRGDHSALFCSLL